MMTSVVLKAILGGSVQQWARPCGVVGRLQASTFASSSRVGLDFTRPINAAPDSTTTTAASATTSKTTLQDAAGQVETQRQTEQTAETSSSEPASLRSSATSRPARTVPLFGAKVEPTASTASTTSTTTSSAPIRSSKGKMQRLNIESHREPIHLSTNNKSTAPTHTLTVVSTRNNCLLTFSDYKGPLFPTITAGTDKTFKKSQRSSYEAAHQATLKMMERILDFAARATGRVQLRIAFKGMFGQGRQAVSSAIGGPDGIELRRSIVRVEDRTPIKVGGTRARKARRV